MKQTLIFHHIPKTAGSTFLNILKKMYSNYYQIDGMLTDESMLAFRRLSQPDKNQFNLIMGHQAIHLLDEIQNEKKIVSFFRDPLEQFISSFFYIKGAVHNKHHEAVKKISTIEDYLSFCVDVNVVNPQSRSLIVPHFEDLTNDDNTVERALNVLSRIDYPCITEEFDKSLILLRDSLSWKKDPVYLKANKSKKMPLHLSAFFKQQFHEVYFSDLIVFDEVKKQFDRNTNHLHTKSIDKFKLKNSFYNPLMKLKSILG